MGHKTGVGPRVAEPCAAGEPQGAGSARTSRLQPPRRAPGTATTAPTQPARGKHTEEVTTATGTGRTNKAVPSHGPLVGRQSSTSDSSFHGDRAVPVSLPLGGGGIAGSSSGPPARPPGPGPRLPSLCSARGKGSARPGSAGSGLAPHGLGDACAGCSPVPAQEYWQSPLSTGVNRSRRLHQTAVALGLRSGSGWCRGFSATARGSAFFPSTLFRMP